MPSARLVLALPLTLALAACLGGGGLDSTPPPAAVVVSHL